MNLNHKKILFISAHFFGYEKAIVSKLKSLGAEVDFFNERPSNSVLTKGIIRVNSTIYQRRINRYYQDILNQTSAKNYDFFLLIKGESIPFFFLDEFKKTHPNAKTIFYAYDAAREYPKFKELYRYFDQNFTFEYSDAEQYKLHFRPLFFLEEYINTKQKKQAKYDLVFIGSAHTDRYLIGEKLQLIAKNLGLTTFFYYYAPSKMVFLLKKIFDKSLQKFNIKKLSFTKLHHSEIAEIYEDSFAVLDMNKPFQLGLTMRTFEALASGKKLVTTNPDIQNYPFYSSQNVFIVDRENETLDADFFKTSFQKIDQDILSKMTLESWIECLFITNQDRYWAQFRNKN